MKFNIKQQINFCFTAITKATKSQIFFLMLANVIYAQSPPDWTVQENNYEYTMTLVGFLTVDNNRLSNGNDKVAAFVDGELRGVTNLNYVESEKAYYAYLTIFANQNGETINFKIYDSENDTTVDVDTTLDFEILAHTGDLFQAFSIASPELSDQVEVIGLSFQGVEIVNFSQNNDVISLGIINSGNIGLSTIEFELSSGADMIFNNEVITSGVSNLNIANTSLEVQIRSENQSVIRNVIIQINLQDKDDSNENLPRFFRRNEVCHTLGAIRVVSNSNGGTVILKQNNTTISESIISNSKVLFDNLQAGVYEVVIVGSPSITKTITINYDK
jgi:hypothetical protein